MPYFPERDTPGSYYCPKCKEWYAYGDRSCLVLHAPGTCCHEYEKKLGDRPPREVDMRSTKDRTFAGR